MTDATTKRWIRCEADEVAVAAGCWFEEKQGQAVIDFIEEHLRLYEGEHAGETPHIMEWQHDLLMRLFGWVRHSDDWPNREYIRRFRKASVWIPKKNGKSPTAAMVGLFLLCADGEMGQKVFSAAKDGKQAGIVHTHARMMVEQSPALEAECQINKSTGRITHHPSRSFYDILSGDNIQGQEGLNGSVIIDETHVVDDRLAKVLEYMGASRVEPIQFEVSTAGNNPDGYGKKQQDYGRRVESGEVHDIEFLFVCHEAPQDSTDEQCESPAVWKQANPSWGHTIKEGEFRASCTRAKRSLSDWNTWKMYRLNIWGNSANPWLKESDWSACQATFDMEDMRKHPCWIGLDLSKTRDTTAAVYVWKVGDEFTVWPTFYLPEEAAREAKVEYLQWEREGFITLTPGRVVDYSYIESDIVRACGRVKVEGIVYDQTYAEELTQRIVDSTGVRREAFPQTMQNFANPTAEFERCVTSRKLRHPGNKVLNWQARNATVKPDANGNIRPVKPTKDDYRKIDGVVAAIMGFARVMQPPDPGTIYNRRGVIRV